MKSRLPQRLKELRAVKNISQAKLAEAVNISISFVAEIEMGRSSVSTELLIALADFFGVSTDYLLGRDIVVSTSIDS